MKLAAILGTLFGLVLAGRVAAASDLADLAAGAKASVVLISLYDESGRLTASGSGFFVSSGGRLVTNHHVIEDASKATATFADGRVVPIAGVLADDPEHDLAIVQAEGSSFAALTFADPASVHTGDEVVVIGSPLGLSAAVSTGIVAAVRDEGLSKEKGLDEYKDMAAYGLQITAPISHGSSGSPVLDTKGRVIGVAVAVFAQGENVNFAIPVKFVAALLRTVADNAVPRPIEGESDARRNLLITGGLVVVPALGYWLWVRRRKSLARRAVAKPTWRRGA
jgi:S1-C subfamily serine protease